MIREISYYEVKDSLKTGDLVMFHGIQPVSKLIELLEWSYWSHVGIVVLPKDIGLEGEEPLFWESTSSSDGISDVILNKPKDNGAMLVPLSERIKVDLEKQYDTHFKIKYLNRILDENELLELKNFIELAHKKAFPSTSELLVYYIEGRHSNVKSPDNVCFCSQLTAETFMHLGFLSTTYASNGYCPNDFNEDDDLPVLKEFSFSDGARIKKLNK